MHENANTGRDMNFQLFVDMDGVLADFDKGYEIAFGRRPSKTDDNVDWDMVREHKGFYRHLPPMPDFQELWSFISQFSPIVLTGVPSSVPEAAVDKRGWLTHYTSISQPMIACKSAEKSLFMRNSGDVIIDDWEKYKHVWLRRGGRWITHVSAKQSIEELRELLD